MAGLEKKCSRVFIPSQLSQHSHKNTTRSLPKSNRKQGHRGTSETDLSPPSHHFLVDKLSQSVPVYKHVSLDRPVGYPSTAAVQAKHVAMLISKTMVKCSGAVQIKP